MKIYIHKVYVNVTDGWGRSVPGTEVLGMFSTREKAEKSKLERDSDPNPDKRRWDVGSSWIEEKELQ